MTMHRASLGCNGTWHCAVLSRMMTETLWQRSGSWGTAHVTCIWDTAIVRASLHDNVDARQHDVLCMYGTLNAMRQRQRQRKDRNPDPPGLKQRRD